MMTIVLRGKLGKKFGRKWRLDVRSPAEAFRAIDILKGGFFDYIAQLESEMRGYHVEIGEKTIDETMLDFGFETCVVTVTPILQGADTTKNILTIVAGVALIAIGWATYGTSALIGTQLIGLGLAVALGGVARFLMSAPNQTLGTQDKNRASYVFTGVVNTIQQGECVPVIYGRVISGSAVTSAGVETEDVSN